MPRWHPSCPHLHVSTPSLHHILPGYPRPVSCATILVRKKKIGGACLSLHEYQLQFKEYVTVLGVASSNLRDTGA